MLKATKEQPHAAFMGSFLEQQLEHYAFKTLCGELKNC